MGSDSRAARLSLVLGVVGSALFVSGPLLAHLGLASPFVGFHVFGVGFLLGLLALVCGIVGAWRTRSLAGRGGRGSAIAGIGLGGVLTVIVAAVLGSAEHAPLINDITTDPEDPPVFRLEQNDVAHAGRDLSYPGEAVASEQRKGYPDLAPIRVNGPPDAVFRRCLEVARQLGWQITSEDPAVGTFQAIDVTRLFHFVDDIAVRVRETGSGTIVDVRSKSRDGRGDLGTNAARIRAFRDELVR